MSSLSKMRGLAAVTRLIVVTTLFLLTLQASGAANQVQPEAWPSTNGLSPQLESWPNAIRFSGPDRYQTSLSSVLALRGTGSFPYLSVDPSPTSFDNSADKSYWWGAGVCPRSVILVAGDSPADALSAAALSDPTGKSSEPLLRRSAGADPLFDPVGGYKRVDTNYAPIVLTNSARSGSRSLNIASLYAVRDLRTGGCRSAREAIIVGGYSAVPREVEDQLLANGYNSVYRVSGANRYATARAVAVALGTAPLPVGVSGCTDGSTSDGSAEMTYYANSVVEWRDSASQCQILGRTVVLADGKTGADALAAGWWTSFWQVPVLLHDGSNQLPPNTAAALQTMQISNIIVLGGEKRVPDVVAEAAGVLARAVVHRVAGVDRYETSVMMAKIFGGWWASNSASDFDSSMICVAGSAGDGARNFGWADALGAGAWCSALSVTATMNGAPERQLGPTVGSTPMVTSSLRKSGRAAVPVVLVRPGSDFLPTSVRAFLQNVFEPSFGWCSSQVLSAYCTMPGFAVAFGGDSVVSDGVMSTISSLMGGSEGDEIGVSTPSIAGAYGTKLSQWPVSREAGQGDINICIPRDGYKETGQFALGDNDNPHVTATTDVMAALWYVIDSDGKKRSSGTGSPGCLRTAMSETLLETNHSWIRAVGIDGRTSIPTKIEIVPKKELNLDLPIAAAPVEAASGTDSYLGESSLGLTSWSFSSVAPPSVLTFKHERIALIDSSITIQLQRNRISQGNDVGIHTFKASWMLTTLNGFVKGFGVGEAIFSDGTWYLRGKASLNDGDLTQSRGQGGFWANISVNTAGLTDDSILWQVDFLGLENNS